MESGGVILAYAGRGQLWTREGVTVAHVPLKRLTLQHRSATGSVYEVVWKHYGKGEAPQRGRRPAGWYLYSSGWAKVGADYAPVVPQ